MHWPVAIWHPSCLSSRQQRHAASGLQFVFWQLTVSRQLFGEVWGCLLSDYGRNPSLVGLLLDDSTRVDEKRSARC